MTANALDLLRVARGCWPLDRQRATIQELVVTQVIARKHLLLQHAASPLFSVLLHRFVVGKVNIYASAYE